MYILPYLPSTLGVFLMKQYMDSSIPDALLEAARIDGAGFFRMFIRIALPIVRPAWLTLALFAFPGFMVDAAKRHDFQRGAENTA